MTLHSSAKPPRAVEDLLSQLPTHINGMRAYRDRRSLIAIDGHSGAGKSTIAAHVARSLLAAKVSCDDFYAGGVNVLTLDSMRLADICIDRARLRAVLSSLKAGCSTQHATFDWHAFNGSLTSSKIATAPRPIIIAEGVYSAHPDLRDIVDVSVLVRTPPVERERRLLEREEKLGPWEQQWHRAEDWYFKTLAPPEAFDIVLENV